MAERKYIKIYLYIILIVSFVYNLSIYASAYVPEEGRYKYITSFSFSDRQSKQGIRARLERFKVIKDQMNFLGAKRAQIILASELAADPLSSTGVEIQEIDDQMSQLSEEVNNLGSFSDDKTFYFEVEYSLDEVNSMGSKIGYHTNDFTPTKKVGLLVQQGYSISDAQDIECFYKRKLWQDKHKQLIVAIQSKIYYSIYKKIFDLGFLVGNYRKKKHRNYSNFTEVGIEFRKYFNRDSSRDYGYNLSLLEGMKFNNGIMICNYVEYHSSTLQSFLYNKTIYNQISIAKEFYFDSLKSQSITVQFGYFLKASLVDRNYVITGPIFSVWYNL